jgi:hypothetical protein
MALRTASFINNVIDAVNILSKALETIYGSVHPDIYIYIYIYIYNLGNNTFLSAIN